MEIVINALRNNVVGYFIERDEKARGRWFIDGLLNRSGFELFVGRVHIVIDPFFMGRLWGWYYKRVTTAR